MKIVRQFCYRLMQSRNLNFAMILLSVVVFFQYAQAENHKTFTGAWGVNRVIRSTAGPYTKHKVKGYLRFYGLPENGGIYKSTPSFYTGGSVGSYQIDAGMQYETQTFGRYKPGWVAFISIGDEYSNPEVLRSSTGEPIAWRGGPISTGNKWTSSINTTIEYEIYSDGKVSLTVDALKTGGREPIIPNSGRFFYRTPGTGKSSPILDSPTGPWNPNNTIGPRIGENIILGDRTKATVKRVVAMTRQRPNKSQNDGSHLICTIEGNFGAPIDQAVTGYDAPANEADGHKDLRGSYKVNFPNLNISPKEARTGSIASVNAKQKNSNNSYQSRYDLETVEINLRYSSPMGRGKRK